MILDIVESLLGDAWGTSDTYHPILAACILGPPRRVMIAVGDGDMGVHNVILGAGNDGGCVCDIVTNGRNGWICAYCKFLLEA